MNSAPMTHQIARSLPSLRRYAQALVGSKTAGDRYTRACIEVAICDPSGLRQGGDPKFALFKLLHDILRVTAAITMRRSERIDPQDVPRPAEMQRRLALLTIIGGFSPPRAMQLVLTTSDEAELRAAGLPQRSLDASNGNVGPARFGGSAPRPPRRPVARANGHGAWRSPQRSAGRQRNVTSAGQAPIPARRATGSD